MVQINDDLKIYFPIKYSLRDQQLEAINFVKKSINSGKRNILLDLPTGSGKSMIVSLIANYYKLNINPYAKFDVITNSKILQDQYTKEYTFKCLKGRVNYNCEKYNTDCKAGHNICSTEKGLECDCPYDKAKKEWLASDIGLTNFHMFNTTALYARNIFDARESNVLIVDEAHGLEDIFSDLISTDLCSKSLKKYGFSFKEVEDYESSLSKMNTIDKYVGFIKNQFISDIENKINWLTLSMDKANKKMKIEYSNYKTYADTQLLKFKYLIKEYEKDPSNWVLEKVNENNKILLEAKPVWGKSYMNEKLFAKYDHIIFMSATILDLEMFTYINGLEPELTSYFSLPTPFDIRRHPIYYIKVGKMTWNEKHETFKNQLVIINKILKKYKTKGIFHVNSFEFSKMLEEQCDNDRLLFHSSDNRDEILEKHINADYNSVIVSPSMIEGISLDHDLSRFQCIIKVPYPFLGSEKIKRRIATNNKWYTWKTVCDLLQMSGRSMRDSTDYCESFILDSSFSDLLKNSNNLFPRWWTSSIKTLKM